MLQHTVTFVLAKFTKGAVQYKECERETLRPIGPEVDVGEAIGTLYTRKSFWRENGYSEPPRTFEVTINAK